MKNYEVCIGIDVSKKTLDVSLIVECNLTTCPHQRFENTPKSMKQIISFIKQHTKSGVQGWLFCMEHTGIYTMHLCTYLSSKKMNYALVPAIEIQRSIGLKRGKSDKADSKAIAKYAYLRKDEITLSRLPEKLLIKLKLMISYRDRLVRSKKILGVISKEMQEFLKQELTQEVNKSSNKVIEKINSEIKIMDDKIMKMIEDDEPLKNQYDLIVSVPGVGPQTACYLIVTTRCFTAFETARQLACYAGVAPFEHTSGSSIRGKTRVSPLANKKLKSLLGMCALNSKRVDQQLALYYQRKTDEGKNKLSVLNALKSKLLQRIFATVKRGTPYVHTMNYAA